MKVLGQGGDGASDEEGMEETKGHGLFGALPPSAGLKVYGKKI